MEIKDLLRPGPSPRLSRPAQLPLSSTSTRFPADLHGQDHRQQSEQLPAQPNVVSKTLEASVDQSLNINPAPTVGTKHPLPAVERAIGSSVYNQWKWSLAEDGMIIKLRKSGMDWEDVCKYLPGRSAINCRSRFQDCLESWVLVDQEQRNKLLKVFPLYEWEGKQRSQLARVCHRLKPYFWKRVAEELNMPWQACERMHWAISEQAMAQRANGTPYTAPNEGRMAQKGRILEPTRISEGPDLTPLPSPFTSVDSGDPNHCHGHGLGHGILGYPKQNLSGHGEARDEKVRNEDIIEGPRDKKGKQPGNRPTGTKRTLSEDGPGARRKKVLRFETGPTALAGEEKNGGCDRGNSLIENQTAKAWTGPSLTNSKQENTGPAAAILTSDEYDALDRRLRKPFGFFGII